MPPKASLGVHIWRAQSMDLMVEMDYYESAFLNSLKAPISDEPN